MRIEIRKGLPGDFPSLLLIDQLAKEGNDRYQLLGDMIKSGAMYLAIHDTQPVGLVIMTYGWYRLGFVELLVVREEYQKQGIGKKLLAHCESLCSSNKLFTSTNKSNPPAKALLEKCGFVESGIIHNLDENDPEIVYSKLIR